MGAITPVAWCHEYGGGRCFYTALATPRVPSPSQRSFVTSAVRWSG